jgi:hypothetical protein
MIINIIDMIIKSFSLNEVSLINHNGHLSHNADIIIVFFVFFIVWQVFRLIKEVL